MAKIKGKRGFRFIKELGGAIRRGTVSKTARFLDEHRLLRGRVLDYGCGFGFDADHFGWEAYDPHYRQKVPDGFEPESALSVVEREAQKTRIVIWAEEHHLPQTRSLFEPLLRTVESLAKARLLDRLQQIVDGVHCKRSHRVLVVRRHERD